MRRSWPRIWPCVARRLPILLLAVKVLMLATVGLSAWLNYEHGLLLQYPVAVRVLFASPAVIGGSLFELQLRSLHRTRLHELGRVAEPLPRFGTPGLGLPPVCCAAAPESDLRLAAAFGAVERHRLDRCAGGSGKRTP